ncbi:MAG: SGNH/GDSL hydrolase family protein [Clostridia bacterium]|nr:SGNH/GDSL hydrolase family protein [Clostridia bacterium]
MKKRLIISSAICLAVLIVSLYFAQALLVPKYVSVSPEGALTAEYYAAADETSHDVLFIGDCEVYESFVPAVLWEKYGISSYVRGSAQQLVWHSYYLLEDALRYETPKAVVFNVLALKYGQPQSEAYNRMTIDGMEWSQSKVDAIIASKTEDESFLSYVFPLLRFHSRWDELTGEDLEYMLDRPEVSDSGYLIQTDVRAAEPDDLAIEGSPLADYTLPKESMAYLDKIKKLCDDNGIELILIKAPTNSWRYWWYDEWDAQIVDYAGKNGLAYYNFIDEVEDIGIDWSQDTYDGGVHLNVYGAMKLTEYFGKTLRDAHGIPDRHEDTNMSAVWSGRVESFYSKLTDNIRED